MAQETTKVYLCMTVSNPPPLIFSKLICEICCQVEQYIERAEHLKELLHHKRPSLHRSKQPERLLGKVKLMCYINSWESSIEVD